MRRLRPILQSLALIALLGGAGAFLQGISGPSPTPLAEPAAEPPAKEVAVRVLSYNAWLVPFVSEDRAGRAERMVDVLGARQPDVLCLQEVWMDDELLTLQRGFEETLPHMAFDGGGVAILSRWPVVRWSFTPFPPDDALSATEKLGGKGVLDTVVDTPAGPLRLLATHFALDRSRGRMAQKRQLEAFLALAGPPDDIPTVLCADLNLRAVRDGALTPRYQRLLDAGFVDGDPPPRQADGTLGRRSRTRVGWPRRGRAGRGWDPDYLMHRAGAQARLDLQDFRVALDTPETALSDHNLLEADYRLVRSAEKRR